MPIPLGILATTGGASGGAPAYELISTSYGDGSSGTITFSSIPSTYKHLQIRLTSRIVTATAQSEIQVRFNGISSGSYAGHYLYGNGSSVIGSNGGSSATEISSFIPVPGASASANIFSTGILDVLDYTSSVKNTTMRHLSGMYSGNKYVVLGSGLLNNTAAITSISLLSATGDGFTTTSRFSLYGIVG
jgi:hypothetical protein